MTCRNALSSEARQPASGVPTKVETVTDEGEGSRLGPRIRCRRRLSTVDGIGTLQHSISALHPTGFPLRGRSPRADAHYAA